MDPTEAASTTPQNLHINHETRTALELVQYNQRRHINSLPPEILHVVFLPVRRFDREYYTCLFTSRMVCKYWMEVIDSTPKLWNSISSRLDPELQAMIMQNSRNRLLVVEYNETVWDSRDRQREKKKAVFESLMKPSASRWQVWNIAHRTAPSLETLNVKVRQTHDTEDFTQLCEAAGRHIGTSPLPQDQNAQVLIRAQNLDMIFSIGGRSIIIWKPTWIGANGVRGSPAYIASAMKPWTAGFLNKSGSCIFQVGLGEEWLLPKLAKLELHLSCLTDSDVGDSFVELFRRRREAEQTEEITQLRITIFFGKIDPSIVEILRQSVTLFDLIVVRGVHRVGKVPAYCTYLHWHAANLLGVVGEWVHAGM
ncbi:hypothetical protein M407DRAFT_214159 [Tulasnella calospora MUT 4182]|uniref:Uncharacterized protein n=1 Tax=Tulasnella calospora MUT 4182 TaxID=1051891 RepID=A0A0C3QDG6_9AGAM|nr:hypothetical protein M407DRAFT_214159 [Tulasnella calospora MUT 4182]